MTPKKSQKNRQVKIFMKIVVTGGEVSVLSLDMLAYNNADIYQLVIIFFVIAPYMGCCWS